MDETPALDLPRAMNVPNANLPSSAPITPQDPSFISALARGLAVIRAFGQGRERLTLADIAKSTDLPRATVRRSLLTLQALGYVATDGKHFTLTPSVLSLGYAYLSATPLPRAIQPTLEMVSERTNESSSAAILDGAEIVYVARAATRRIMSVGLSTGSRLPAYCSSLGRVLLAFEPRERAAELIARIRPQKLTPHTVTDPKALLGILDEVRARGYSLVDEELEIGLRSIAVPVRNASGQVVAAMNVSAQAGRISREDLLRDILPVLTAAAASVQPALA
jgi:IclR family pca regulon transcriptional regulator